MSVLVVGIEEAAAQSLRDQVSNVVTAQGPTGASHTPDSLAADRSRETLLALFGVELSSTPLASGSSGFTYEFNSALGVPARTSQTFGAFFTERAQRSGEGQWSLGLVVQNASFTSVQGADLTNGAFPVNAQRAAGTGQPLAVDSLRLQLSTSTITLRTVYGVTDRLDIGGAIPFVQARFDGTRVTTVDSQPTFQFAREGRASGLGDAAFTARYRLAGRGATGLAVGTDIRLPTGRASNLLGTGKVAARGQVIGTAETGRFGVSANVGAGTGGASDEWFASGAVTVAAAPRVTLVGEVLGRRLTNLHRLLPVYAPHTAVPQVESMRWVADERTAVAIGYAVAGAKWNISGSVLLSANVLMRFTDGGLRARVTPSLTLDYDFPPF
ncbi:MAG TPA: hypothetical protein VMF13_09995 [Luteitalea sp.]|nr:hypothetical protein [Luteitalea sp.]